MKLFVCLLFTFSISRATDLSVNVTPSVTFQTHRYSMLEIGVGPGPNGLNVVEADPLWPLFKAAYFTKLVHELGINALRIDLLPGDIENDADYFTSAVLGPGPYANWCCNSSSHAQNPVNDDNDPQHFNCADPKLVNCPNTFPFAAHDYVMGNWVTGANSFVAVLRAAGKVPFLLVTYNPRANVTFISNDCRELGEQYAALFVHDKNKWDIVPDAIDMINEPDMNGGTNWTSAKIGTCAAVVKSRLNGMGFFPQIWAPSTTFASRAVSYYNDIVKAAGPGVVDVLSWHNYDGASNAVLSQIAAAAPTNVMTEFDIMNAPMALRMLSVANTVGLNRFGVDSGGMATSYGAGSCGWLNITSDIPFRADYSPGNVGPCAGYNSGPLWFFPQLYGYLPAGSVREQTTTSGGGCAGGTGMSVGYVSGGEHRVVMLDTCSGTQTFNVTGLPAGLYGCTYTVSNSTLLAPCGPNKAIAAGAAVSYTISSIPTPANGLYTIAVTVYSVTSSPSDPKCDVNNDGTNNVLDVQREINEALGVTPASHDLNQDGKVSVAEVQIVINAALGLGCTAK